VLFCEKKNLKIDESNSIVPPFHLDYLYRVQVGFLAPFLTLKNTGNFNIR
jgi:hypothetical protein